MLDIKISGLNEDINQRKTSECDRLGGQEEWKPAMVMTETKSSWKGSVCRMIRNFGDTGWKPSSASFGWLCRQFTDNSVQSFPKPFSRYLESLYNFPVNLASLGQDHHPVKYHSSQ